MDSLIHRFSSNKWPMMMQAHRRATKRFIETTEAWSEVMTVVSLSYNATTAIVVGNGMNQLVQTPNEKVKRQSTCTCSPTWPVVTFSNLTVFVSSVVRMGIVKGLVEMEKRSVNGKRKMGRVTYIYSIHNGVDRWKGWWWRFGT